MSHAARNTIVAASLACALVGCVGGRSWNPFAESGPAVLSQSSTREDVVAHLNRNISRCTGWRSTDIKVGINGIPLKASAMLAVESPRRFRMQVSSLMGDLADLGSNDDRMWFWQRPSAEEPQYVYTCAHQDLATAQERIPIPFRPDWLMEVLGVIPIDAAQMEMTAVPGDAGQFLLTSLQVAPDGTQVKKVITVDSKRGVIVAHELRAADGTGAPIARAVMSEHRRDEASGVTLPHRIVLSYPAAQAEMTIAINAVEVNPTAVTPNTWQPIVAANCPFRDLASGQVVTLDQVRTY